MKTHRATLVSSRRVLSEWMFTLAATAASTYARDAVAMATGVLLVASGLLRALDHPLARLARRDVRPVRHRAAGEPARQLAAPAPDQDEYQRVAKAAFELTGRRVPRAQQVAAGAGYVATERAKEAPYYAGAFGAAVLTDAVSSNDALLFLAGANLGAAANEYGLARVTRRLLRRPRCASFDTDWVPRECLADYYRSGLVSRSRPSPALRSNRARPAGGQAGRAGVWRAGVS